MKRTLTGATRLLPLAPLHLEIAAEIHRLSFADSWTAESIGSLLATPGAAGFVALVEGVPVGIILFRTAADEGEILTIAVLPSVRRSGLGSALLQAALEHVRNSGARAVFLEVAKDNDAAQSLYLAAGFEAVGRRPNYYSGSAERADAEIYRLALSTCPQARSTAVSE